MSAREKVWEKAPLKESEPLRTDKHRRVKRPAIQEKKSADRSREKETALLPITVVKV